MNQRTIIALILMIMSQMIYAQTEKKHTYKVYFDTDKHVLKPTYDSGLAITLDSLLDRHIIDSIHLVGNTDSRASLDYNLALSKRRINVIQEWLAIHSIDTSIINTFPLGETTPIADNTTASGMQQNRRTDVVFFYHTIPVPQVSIPEPPIIPEVKVYEPPVVVETPPEEDCNKDTTIYLPNGSMMVFNLCEFESMDSCFSVEEYLDVETVTTAGLTTMTADGEPLISAGMFNVSLCEGVCGTLLVPVIANCAEADVPPMRLWSMADEGGWEEPGGEVDITTVDGEKYYKIRTCGGMRNLDAKPPKYTKVRVKAPKNMRIVDARLLTSSPLMITPAFKYKKKGKKAVIGVPKICPCQEPILSVMAIDEVTGDTLIMEDKVASEHKFKRRKGTCSREPFLWVFRVKRHGYYKGYHLKEEDFIPLHEKKDAYTQH